MAAGLGGPGVNPPGIQPNFWPAKSDELRVAPQRVLAIQRTCSPGLGFSGKIDDSRAVN